MKHGFIPTTGPRAVPLTITQAFDSQQEFRALLTLLSFPANTITRLMDSEGINSARELSNQKPNNLASSLESVNRIAASNNRQEDRAYFSTARIQKLKALCAYF